MKNDTVKQVLSKLVQIDTEAEEKLLSHKTYVREQDIRVKHELKELELSLMKDMRKLTKEDYNQKMQAANVEVNDILRASSEYSQKVMTYYNDNKQELINTIFKDVFGDA